MIFVHTLEVGAEHRCWLLAEQYLLGVFIKVVLSIRGQHQCPDESGPVSDVVVLVKSGQSEHILH